MLGKTVIDCRYMPGFIANRIGCDWIFMAILTAKHIGLTVELAYAMNVALTFRAAACSDVSTSSELTLCRMCGAALKRTLATTDDQMRFDQKNDPLVTGMIAKGQFGRKAKVDFSRRAADGSFDTMDLLSGDCRKAIAATLPHTLIADEGANGLYARSSLSDIIAYAC